MRFLNLPFVESYLHRKVAHYGELKKKKIIQRYKLSN